jgi:hypothetical protein
MLMDGVKNQNQVSNFKSKGWWRSFMIPQFMGRNLEVALES